MMNRKKAIEILSHHTQNGFGDKEDELTVPEIIELLKEDEPIAPKQYAGFQFCGNCGMKLVFNKSKQASYCWECGKAVKW